MLRKGRRAALSRSGPNDLITRAPAPTDPIPASISLRCSTFWPRNSTATRSCFLSFAGLPVMNSRPCSAPLPGQPIEFRKPSRRHPPAAKPLTANPQRFWHCGQVEPIPPAPRFPGRRSGTAGEETGPSPFWRGDTDFLAEIGQASRQAAARAKRDRLFMAAATSLYSLYVATQGVLRP